MLIATRIAVEAARMENAKAENAVEVLEIHTFKPFDNEGVKIAAKNKKVIITVEDNSGILSEKVAAALSGESHLKTFSFKFPDEFTHFSGSQKYLFQVYGITAENICAKISELLSG